MVLRLWITYGDKKHNINITQQQIKKVEYHKIIMSKSISYNLLVILHHISQGTMKTRLNEFHMKS
jgi:hypothetical protein